MNERSERIMITSSLARRCTARRNSVTLDDEVVHR